MANYYSHNKKGDYIKIEVRDQTRRKLFSKEFNVNNKEAIYETLKILEKFSEFSISEIIQEKMELGKWF